MMGNRPGRVCLIYQIDFSEDELEFSVKNRLSELAGTVHNESDFSVALSAILDFFKSDRIETALKFFRPKGQRITGICPKSFPKTPLTIDLLSKLNLCVGGANGTDLINFPEAGGLFDQPNLFIEGYFIYVDEFNKFVRSQKETPKKAISGRPR